MFLRGDDVDFDYSLVDGNDDFDDRKTEEREAQESWFEAEEPEWAVDEDRPSTANRQPRGQTGVQDF